MGSLSNSTTGVGGENKPPTIPSGKLTKDLFRLDERTVLITGGGGAMVLEVASSVLESGGDVVRLPRNIKPKYGIALATSPTRNEIRSLFETVMSKVRYPLRGLVTCAGISGGGPTVGFSIEKARRIIDINLVGTFLCARAAAIEWQQHNFPGSKGVDTAAYNSSKAAVQQLARSLAAEWGCRPGTPSIRVNSICPGYIKTRMTMLDLEDPNKEREWSEQNMLNRLSYAGEYRGPIMFLLSDARSFVTGTDLRVDGGHTAW